MVVKYSLIMAQRNYQRFRGNNKFYCGGRLMSARQVGVLVFCAIAIIVMSLLFFAFDARFLVLNVHPIGVGAIFPVVGVLGVFYSLSFLLKTGCTDPGILPRGLPDELEYNQGLGDIDPNNTASGYLGVPARYMTVTVKGQQMRLKWCPTCNIWRPPRASHCGLCNNCYEMFDHHCPVVSADSAEGNAQRVGNCVAKRNYRYFYLFLCTIFLTSLFVMGCNVAVIVIASLDKGFVSAIKTWPASIVEFGIAGLAAVSVAGLACMHTWLIATMQTTNEDIKGTFNPRRDGIVNPYQQRNCCTNYLMIVCGPSPPSLINRRGIVDEATILEEEIIDGSYGSTTNSAIPKLPPEPIPAPTGEVEGENQGQSTREDKSDTDHNVVVVVVEASAPRLSESPAPGTVEGGALVDVTRVDSCSNHSNNTDLDDTHKLLSST